MLLSATRSRLTVEVVSAKFRTYMVSTVANMQVVIITISSTDKTTVPKVFRTLDTMPRAVFSFFFFLLRLLALGATLFLSSIKAAFPYPLILVCHILIILRFYSPSFFRCKSLTAAVCPAGSQRKSGTMTRPRIIQAYSASASSAVSSTTGASSASSAALSCSSCTSSCSCSSSSGRSALIDRLIRFLSRSISVILHSTC